MIRGGHTSLPVSKALPVQVRVNRVTGGATADGRLALGSGSFTSYGVKDRLRVAAQIRAEATLLIEVLRLARPVLHLRVDDYMQVQSEDPDSPSEPHSSDFLRRGSACSSSD